MHSPAPGVLNWLYQTSGTQNAGNAQVFFYRTRARYRNDINSFLRNVEGVIHIGANVGQERSRYANFGLRVVWIEPIPEVFRKLETRIRRHPLQRAYRYLVTDADDQEYEFHIASNNGSSSSIYEIKMHQDIWPEVSFVDSIRLRSKTLESVVHREGISIGDYDALIMDTQGSELLVLKGAAALLPNFRYIKTEVADFEAYEGCCQLQDIDRFLSGHGFREQSRRKLAERTGGGSYFDIVYERMD